MKEIQTNPNFDIDKIPDEYYEQLKSNGWLDEFSQVVYVTADNYGTVITTIKSRNEIDIVRQFKLGDTIAFSHDLNFKI